METSAKANGISNFNLVKYSFEFFWRHFIFVFVAGLIAAVGRAIQLGAMGEISGDLNSILEIVIAAARIFTFLLVIGEGSVGEGVRRVKRIFLLRRDQWKAIWLTVISRLKANWLALLINLLAYSVIVIVINFAIDKIAYNTNLLKTLQHSNILASNTTEWVLLLFFKNLSVIPFTIILDGFILLWLTNSLGSREKRFGRTI